MLSTNSVLTWAARQAEKIESRYSWQMGQRIRQATNKLARVCEFPIIILGNQKAGTTVIAALLAEHCGLSATLDLDGMKAQVVKNLHKGEYSFSRFVADNKLDFSRAILKEPGLTFLFQQLAAYFPKSKFVFVTRDPRSNIRSILNRLALPGNLAHLDKTHLAQVSDEWKLVLDGRWLGLKGANYIELLAARWNLAASIYLQNSDKCSLVRYEDFLNDKLKAISSLADALGLNQTSSIRGKVDIQYQPAGKRDVCLAEFFGQENLRRIEGICSNSMGELGYGAELNG